MTTKKAAAFELIGKTIFKKSVATKNEDGSTNHTLGFPVCDVSEYVDAKTVLNIFNASGE